MITKKQLEKEIEEVKKVKKIFSEQPNVRGGMSNNPNVEDVKKWHKWYKEKWRKVRKHPLDLDKLKAILTQTNEIIELIEDGCGREINPYKKIKMPCGDIAGGKVLYCERCEELLTKIKGDGE